MISNRVFVLGLVVLCSVLAGCVGAPFTTGDLDEADTEVGDSGSLDPLNGDAGSAVDTGARSDAHADAGAVPAEKTDGDVDAGPGEDAPSVGVADAGHRDDAAPPDAADAGADATDGADAAETNACDGGTLYVHHVGLNGLTWQDCVPTGTYDATQALAACAAYADFAKADAGPSYDGVAGFDALRPAWEQRGLVPEPGPVRDHPGVLVLHGKHGGARRGL